MSTLAAREAVPGTGSPGASPAASDPEAPGGPGTVPPRRRRWRGLLVWCLVLAVAAVAIVSVAGALASRGRDGDPRGVGPGGAGALAALLARHHVDVTIVDDQATVSSDQRGATVVVTRPSDLTPAELARLLGLRPHRLVLLLESDGNLSPLLGVRRVLPGQQPIAPSCGEAAAVRAGVITPGTESLVASASRPARSSCYVAGGAQWLGFDVDGTPVDVLPASLLANERLGTEGNAALGLTLLGEVPRLTWVVAVPPPDQDSVGRDDQWRVSGTLPRWFLVGVVALPLALAVVGYWRGRRLGPVLTERLPVVVPASETVEGHGRLYARHRARERAAAALREASIRRLASVLGADDPARLAELVATRTGRPAGEVFAALAGPDPTDDAALVALKHTLDRIEQEARQL